MHFYYGTRQQFDQDGFTSASQQFTKSIQKVLSQLFSLKTKTPIFKWNHYRQRDLAADKMVLRIVEKPFIKA